MRKNQRVTKKQRKNNTKKSFRSGKQGNSEIQEADLYSLACRSHSNMLLELRVVHMSFGAKFTAREFLCDFPCALLHEFRDNLHEFLFFQNRPYEGNGCIFKSNSPEIHPNPQRSSREMHSPKIDSNLIPKFHTKNHPKTQSKSQNHAAIPTTWLKSQIFATQINSQIFYAIFPNRQWYSGCAFQQHGPNKLETIFLEPEKNH